MPAKEIVMCTGTSAFSRGPDGSITAWNEVAELLMSTPAECVIGQQCHEVMAGRDVFGNDFCGQSCTCQRMAAAGRRIHPFRLTVTDFRGHSLMLRVSILPAAGSDGPELVHLIEPALGSRAFEILTDDCEEDQAPQGPRRASLTRRELQVLRHMAQGHRTDEIAQRLAISPTTVRNHVSRCLHKLEAHTRLEAVGVARKLDIV